MQMEINMDHYRITFSEGSVFYVHRMGLLLVKFTDQVPRFALKMRILEVAPLIVMSPSFAKPSWF